MSQQDTERHARDVIPDHRRSRKSEDEIARYYWPKDSQPSDEPAAWFRAAISDAIDSGIAFAVHRSDVADGHLENRLPPLERLLVDVAQIFDGWKTTDPAAWTSFDESVRQRISEALRDLTCGAKGPSGR